MTPMVEPTPRAIGAFRPIGADAYRTGDGFWGRLQRTNRQITIPHGLAQLEASGVLDNFRHAAAGGGRYRGGNDDAGSTFPFLDTDAYKWLEAVAWDHGRDPDPAVLALAEPVVQAVVAAQRPDGYIGTFVQLTHGQPFRDLEWGHELYNVGHLTQAAVAWSRAADDRRLLDVAIRACDFIADALGPGRRAAVEGHPEIEMALVELYRETGQERHLAFARHLIDQRGRGLLGRGRFGVQYWQDHAPVRDAPHATGHAVRQMYLECGAVDVAVETGDRELLDAVIRRWDEMRATRTYLTGALGARHHGESFGDAYELPPDRAYAETCAAIGSVMLAWRLWLATGDARFGDAIERALYNSVISGLALEGDAFYYVNPLLVRPGATGYGGGEVRARQPWYACACCPPNLMRTIASFGQMVASSDAAGVVIGQFATGELTVELPAGRARLAVTTGYPWSGEVTVEIVESPAEPWRLGLRVPSWSPDATLALGAQPLDGARRDGFVAAQRRWTAGERVTLRLDVSARLTRPDEHIDAVRGCAAIERGPIVYCLEQVDVPEETPLMDLRLLPDPGAWQEEPDGPLGLPAIRVPVTVAATTDPVWPYGATAARDTAVATAAALSVAAIPYFAWANRKPGAMRVWVPLAQA
jgi:DUF1680 family protein